MSRCRRSRQTSTWLTALVLRRAEEIEHGNSGAGEVLEQPGDGVGVEQLLPGPRLRPQQVMLEGVEKRQHTFQQPWLDSLAGRCPGRRRGNRRDGGWRNRRAGEQHVEWEVADRVGRSRAEQMRDIAADVPLAVTRNDPGEPDPVLQALDRRRQPLGRLIGLAHDAASHRKDPHHALRSSGGHHPPGPGHLVELVSRDSRVPALVQAQQQREVFFGHRSRLEDVQHKGRQRNAQPVQAPQRGPPGDTSQMQAF